MLTLGSLTTVLRILALPLSSNCRSLNQISLKGPALSMTILAYYSCMVRRPPRSCLHAVSSTVRWLCALFSFSQTNAILSWDKTHISTQNTYLKNRPRGATQFVLHNTFLQYTFAQTKLIHSMYNNIHKVLCPQRILKPHGSFPWHCKKLSLQPQTIFTKENIPSLLITFFLCTFTVHDQIIFYILKKGD
jgi:hypothetical protein